MQTLSKTQQKALNYQLVLNSIDGDGYDVELTTDKEKIDFLFKTFESEFDHEIKRRGYNQAFEEWIKGMPSCFNIPFWNDDIIDFCDKLGLIDHTQSEKKIASRKQDLVNNYYKRITSYSIQLKTKFSK